MNIQYYTIKGYTIELKASDTAIVAVSFVRQESKSYPNAITRQCYKEIDEYFKGERTQFQVPIKVNGTVFQSLVWEALQGIAYGSVCSYKDIAKRIGNTQASRAVGNANSKNPICIMIPCHRVIGSDKSLVGYAQGIEIKKFLIEHEQSKMLKWASKNEEMV